MPLPQRQAGFGICVRRAPAHGVEAVPCAAKGADDIDEGLGGFKGNEGHHISFLVCSTPSPFLIVLSAVLRKQRPGFFDEYALGDASALSFIRDF